MGQDKGYFRCFSFDDSWAYQLQHIELNINFSFQCFELLQLLYIGALRFVVRELFFQKLGEVFLRSQYV